MAPLTSEHLPGVGEFNPLERMAESTDEVQKTAADRGRLHDKIFKCVLTFFVRELRFL